MAPVATSPRVERSKAAILEATVALLAEGGVAGLTVDAVAARAGVGKATVYRHWSSRGELVVEAIDSLVRVDDDAADRGSLEAELAHAFHRIVRVCSQPPLSDILPSLVEAAQRDPDLAEVHARFVALRRAALRSALERAEARGELRPRLDLDVVGDLVAGPLFYLRLVRHQTADDAYVASLTDLVLAAVRP